jgi:hypothetical protein
LRIDHFGYCKGPNPVLRIGQNIVVIGRIRSQPQNILKRPHTILKVVITTQIVKSALPMKRHFHTRHNCINKGASASLRHTHLFTEEQVSELQLEKREREREAHSWERTFCICLSYLLALYWLSIIRKFCWVFSPMRVS